MRDLFGHETQLSPPSKGRTVNPLLSVYGATPGETCGKCAHFVRKQMGKVYYKCALTRQSNSATTDWKSRRAACGKFEKAPSETPNFDEWLFNPIPKTAGSILERYYALGYFGTAYKGKKNNELWKAYKAGRDRRQSRVDRYGNPGPVMICDGEWWFAGCFIQDQRSMSCQGLAPFVVFPDRPDVNVLEKTGGNVKTAWNFREATRAAFDWGLEFYSNGSPSNFL